MTALQLWDVWDVAYLHTNTGFSDAHVKYIRCSPVSGKRKENAIKDMQMNYISHANNSYVFSISTGSNIP